MDVHPIKNGIRYWSIPIYSYNLECWTSEYTEPHITMSPGPQIISKTFVEVQLAHRRSTVASCGSGDPRDLGWSRYLQSNRCGGRLGNEGNTAEKKRMRRDSVSGNKGITWYKIRNKHQNVVIVLRDHNHCKTEMMDWQTGKIWQIYDHLRTVISSMRKDFRFTRLARPNSRKAPKQVSLWRERWAVSFMVFTLAEGQVSKSSQSHGTGSPNKLRWAKPVKQPISDKTCIFTRTVSESSPVWQC
jgi:hypothetical protein